MAAAYEQADRFAEAIAHYDHWIAGHPKAAVMDEALDARCWARAEWNRDLDKALADCNQALRLRPRTASYLDSRGLVRLRLGQLDQALADYDAALAIQPKQAWSLYGRGLVKVKRGDKVGGEADMAAALTLDRNLAARAQHLGLAPATPAPTAATPASRPIPPTD